MSLARRRDDKKLMSDINVTPFVDVMLVLLIIFMVTAPMMIQGVEVSLPQTTAKRIKTQEDPLIITVNKKPGKQDKKDFRKQKRKGATPEGGQGRALRICYKSSFQDQKGRY